ncbi:Ig-like domain-containing protein [Pseudomonas cremoricolorata]|uniref:Ig-like domain-containing protein n=1 Tax=Pseudomonas cremoricolorata TaxID=157783 RepID=UPI00040BC06B|nr:Ig-like domain-containing protein [Pseudomonas cremoricolorata]
MDSIVVAGKNTAQSSNTAWGNLTLSQPSVVQLPVSPQSLASVSRSGQDLVLNLKSGERITIAKFFVVDQDGLGNDLVFAGDNGTFWKASYDADAFSGFTFDEVSSPDALLADPAESGGGLSGLAIAGLGLLGVGAAVAASHSGGGGGGHHDEPSAPQAPARPTDLLVSADGLRLSGRGEAGSTIKVRDAAGSLIGSGTVASDGRFDLALDTPQGKGEALAVELSDAAGNVSESGTVNAPDITPPTAPTDLTIDGAGVLLSGRAEAGSTVQVRAADGSLLGSAVSAGDGTFSVTLQPPQTTAQVLQVSATDAAGNTSAPSTVSAPEVVTPPDTSAPDAPLDLLISADGRQLSGRGEAGSSVTVRDAQGEVLANATVAADGSFSVVLDPAVIDGSSVQVELTDAAGNVSEPTSVASPDLTAPGQPSGLALADGVTLTGNGEAGADVQVRDASGALIGSGVVAADGRFSVELDPAQANHEIIDIRLADAAGNVSLPVKFLAPDITPPAAPAELAVSADGAVLTGRAEPGSTVRVVDAQGTERGTALVNAAGSFAVPLDPPQTEGQSLQVSAEDAAGNVSPVSSVIAPNIEPPIEQTPPEAPTDLVISLNGREMSGRGQAGTIVSARDATGTLIGAEQVAADGTFKMELEPAVIDGRTLSVDATDDSDRVSEPATVVAHDLVAPIVALNLALADGVTLTGNAERGATVQVRDTAGALIGSGVAGADGRFSVVLDPIKANGEYIDVVVVDAAGNASVPTVISAPDITAPDAVTEMVVAGNGLAVSGRGEIGATVELRDAQGSLLGSGQVELNGAFVIRIADTVITTGDVLTVIQTDRAGNVSPATDFTVPATPAPATPTDLFLKGGTGDELTGLATAGNRIEVRSADGTLLGSGIVAQNGSFSVALVPTQRNGEVLHVVAVDTATEQPSIPARIEAHESTAPVKPYDLVVSADGTFLTGRGSLNSKIEVYSAHHDLLGSVYVGATGSFAVRFEGGSLVKGETLQVRAQGYEGYGSPLASVSAPNLDAPQSTTALHTQNTLLETAQGQELAEPRETATFTQAQETQAEVTAATPLLAAVVDQQPDEHAGETAQSEAPGFASIGADNADTTLLWQGGDASIDLASLVGEVHDLEVLDLNASSAVSLSLTLDDVLAVTQDQSNTLLIKGDEADTVRLGDAWSLTGQDVTDGIVYNQYTAEEDPSQQLWVQNGVHVV